MDSKARGARAFGSLWSADGKGVVRLEDRYDADINALWSALTDPARVARWYGQVEGDLRPDGKFRLHVESAGWEGTGRVLGCDPPRRLLVTTREADESWQEGIGAEPFEESIEVTLTPDGDQTVLVIEVQGLPLDKIAFYGVGWHVHAENLAAYLSDRDLGDPDARWDELLPHYQDLAAKII